MRNFVMLAVAAGLVLPAAANAQRAPEDRRGPQAEARELRAGNQDSFSGRIAAQVARADQQSRVDQREPRQDRRADRRADRREDRRDVRENRRELREDRREVRDDRRDWRQDRREDRRDWRQDRREDRREDRRDWREDRRDYRQDVRRDYRDYWQDARRDARREARRDQRRAYRDWRAYRQAERNSFRRGAYYAPRGYYYRPVRVGGLLAASVFWGQRYWIDPYEYYLPEPTRHYQRWIRYGNDVLLIDTRNGRVLVVYDNFFW